MFNKSRKDIILIITYIGIVIFTLVNFEKIIEVLVSIINIMSPFLIGIVLAFILNVLNNFFEKKIFGKIKSSKVWNRIKRPLCIILSLILVIAIIILVINLLIPQLRNSASLFTESLPSYKEDILNILNRFDADEGTKLKVSEYLDNFSKVITDYIKGNSKDVISATTEVASSIIGTISKAIISIVFAIYIVAQKETLGRQVNKIMKAYLKPRQIEKINRVGSMANKTFSNFVTGQCLEALIFGSICFIGLLIFDFPYASTIGVLLGFTALIPVFGAIAGTLLGAFLILMVSPVKAILFVVFIIILQQIDNNFIYPRIVGKSIGLPGMWVLMSVTIGASVGGILGMLIATPLCSLLYSLFQEAVNDRIKSNKIVSKVKQKA